MRVSEEPPRVYYVHACYACGEQVDVESARGRSDMEVMGTFAPRHRHERPEDGAVVWVGCGVKELVERNEFVRVKGERDLLRANEASLRSRTERAELQAADWRHTAVTLERLVAQGVRGAVRRWLTQRRLR